MRIRSIATYGRFEDAISRSGSASKQISVVLRRLIAQLYPGVTEVPWPKQGVIGYGLGPKKATEHFCYISPHTNHCNLGFNHGVELPDPNGLLDGSGKRLRHVKIYTVEDVAHPALRELIVAAIEERESTLRRGAGSD